MKVNRQEKSTTRRHMPETEETFLQSHKGGKQKKLQSVQTVDIGELTKVSDKQSP